MMFNNRNVFISPKANIGKNVKIGDNSTIFDNVTIGDNTSISHNCTIGEPLQEYFKSENYINAPTYIGSDSVLRSHTIIYAGNTIGNSFNSAHKVLIREGCCIGNYCMLGVNVEIQARVNIGDYSRLYSNVTISQGTSIGRYVFIFPNVITTNDPVPPSYELTGSSIDDYTIVCAGVTVLPNIKIGKSCLVGANSLVSRSFTDKSFILGNPAKYLMDIEEYKVLGRGKPYPWMKRFSKGMPWELTGFESWLKENYPDGEPFNI